MKAVFSPHWIKSKKPNKQRKFRYNAPLHIRGKFLHVLLAKPLREKYARRSVRVRKGDKVKILRGQFKGKEGKVTRVDVAHENIYLENIQITKKDGSKTYYPLHPSNLMIVELLLDDKKRIAALSRNLAEDQKKKLQQTATKQKQSAKKEKTEEKKQEEVKKETTNQKKDDLAHEHAPSNQSSKTSTQKNNLDKRNGDA